MLQGATFVNHSFEAVSSDEAIGVNFAVYAPQAKQLWTCLFINGVEELYQMYPSELGVWHCFIENIAEGQGYGYRADGLWQPGTSSRFNKHKLLQDPYAREVKGNVTWSSEVYDYASIHQQNNKPCENKWVINSEDNIHCVPNSVVRCPNFDWQSVSKPKLNKENAIIYELHVKGFTMQHPLIPSELRGTYLGLCQPAVIEYFQQLGITTIELLPVTSLVSEERLIKLGLKNYWGYNPLCLMAPEPSYAIDDPVSELKIMVRELHRAGIEVILDVVFNHTCESGLDGPSLSLRGLAESDYYLIEKHAGKPVYMNYTGCGNALNFDSPQTIKLTMDALRRWANEYQIDGFRFDLAPTMSRQNGGFTPNSHFFHCIQQDPVLSQCKMIAEPWDIGPYGYQLGSFPPAWQEWSDRFRDSARSFWRGDHGRLAEMGWRFSGSEDIFGQHRPVASINYLCSHDGFTLNDLVSYEKKHNLANGENNRDGDQHNYSVNHGIEGHTQDRNILKKRLQSSKNMLSLLMLSHGTPMLMAGDEFANTQQGNNNAYCQDSPLSWLDWSWLEDSDSQAASLKSFVMNLIKLRHQHPALASPKARKNVVWYTRDGYLLNSSALGKLNGGSLCVRLSAEPPRGSSALLILLNNSSQDQRFTLPDSDPMKFWSILLNTAEEKAFSKQVLMTRGWYQVQKNSLTVIEEQLGH